jgi:hypothetical protein
MLGKEFSCPELYSAPSAYPAVNELPTARKLVNSASPLLGENSSISGLQEAIAKISNMNI